MTDQTVLDLFRHDVELPRHDHYAHWTPAGCRTLSTEDLVTRCWALADSLSGLGVQEGDRVMLLSENRPEWHIVDLAVLDLGAVDVPVYSTLSPSQLAYQVRDSGASVAVADSPEQMEKFLAVRDSCPQLRHLIQIEGDRLPGVLALDELVAPAGAGSEQRFWDRAAALEEQRLITIIYTSGTTGDPKGVMLSHRNIVQNVLFTLRRLTGDDTDVTLEFLPLCHTAERTAGYCYMRTRTRKAYCSVQHAGELIGTIRPTIFFAVPRVYEKLHQRVFERVAASSRIRQRLFAWALGVGREAAERRMAGSPLTGLAAARHAVADRLVLSKVRGALGGRLRFCITGAAETPTHIAEFVRALGVWMVEAYGLTESSPVIAIGGSEPAQIRPNRVGLPLDNLELRLAPDGELLVRGPSIMMGYWNKPEQTAEAFDEEGFLRTGDIAEIDDDGFVRIIDRKKDLIVTSGGKNVAPQPIESLLKASPYVDAAVVLGDRRRFISALLSPNFEELERWASENGVTVGDRRELVRQPSVIALYDGVVSDVNRNLARYEQVRQHRVLPVSLSIEGGHLTPTMKVKRRAVEQEFAELIEEIYAA
jgi:long-chain acyl-CoA synthetase